MIRIARLDLDRWGHFEERSLAFGPAGRLHLVYGNNEAGKSTTRRAVSALLFGMPARTVDRRGWSYGDLRVGALLEVGGETLEVVRRKGNKDTLLDRAGTTVDEAALLQALGGLSAEVHAGLFEVSHESLVEGGHELLQGRGAVGESLFAAAAGASRLHRLLRELEAEADEIFLPRGRNPLLNQALADHAAAVKALQSASLRPPEHDRMVHELAELEAAAEARGAELSGAERAIGRLERLHGALPLVARRAARAAELEQLGDLPALPADAAQRRREAQARRDDARARAQAAQQSLDRCRPRLDELAVDEALLTRADEVLELHARAAAVRESAEERESLAAQLAEEQAALAALLAALAPALGDRGLDAVALDDAARERLDRCLELRAGVEQAVRVATEALAEARAAAERDEAALAQAGAVADAEPMLAALRAARAAVAGEHTAAEARAAAEAAAARADEEAVRLRPSVGGAQAVAALPVPSAEGLDALLARHRSLTAEREELEAEARALAEEREELHAERDETGRVGAVPSRAAVEAARAHRDACWEGVRAALTDPPADGGRAAADSYEAAVAAADAVADHRMERTDEVARLAAIEQRLEGLERGSAELGRRRARHERAASEAADAWAAAWTGAGDVVPAPHEAPAWLAGRAAVLAALDKAAEATQRADAADTLTRRHAEALTTALRAAGANVAEPTTLAALVELAEAQAEALRTARDARRELERRAEATTAALTDTQRELDAATEALDAWRREWEALRDGVGLDATLTPEDALGTLRRLSTATAAQTHVASLQRRIATIDARAQRFERDAAALTAAVAPDLEGETPRAAVAALQRRVAATQAAAQEQAALRQELAGDEEDLRAALQDAESAEAALAALREAAGAADDEVLALIEERVARAAAVREELAELDAEIAAAGGAPRDEVVAAVADLDADGLPAQLAALAETRDAARNARDDVRERLTRARDELKRVERSDEAAQAAQDAAGHAAVVRALAERYARARLGQRLLRDAVERYRREHEGPMLARANELFPALTCERYVRLVTELDEHDEWVLVAIAADGERRRVEELSDGTREQLFLALRLAAIERYVEVNGAVPVIFDDVVLESDDARAQRVVEVLAELAGRTQVIVLTHHRHLVEIARATVGARRLDVIELSAGASATAPGEADEAGDGDATEAPPSLRDELDALTREPLAGEQGALL